jgi:sporulation protein YlmC with PRC-barrel domain
MLVLANNLQTLPVVSLQDGRLLASVCGLMVEKSSLGVIAFRCKEKKENDLILMGRDVRFVARDCILVNNRDALSNPKDIVRLPTMEKMSYDPIGKQIVTVGGQKLGKVDNYTVDLNAGRIQKLYARPHILQSWLGSSIIIDRTQITELNDREIIVNDTTDYVAESVSAKAPRMSS